MAAKFFVTGGTWHQGGATTQHLLNLNLTVHVLARDPSSKAAPRATTLQKQSSGNMVCVKSKEGKSKSKSKTARRENAIRFMCKVVADF